MARKEEEARGRGRLRRGKPGCEGREAETQRWEEVGEGEGEIETGEEKGRRSSEGVE